MEVAKIRDLRLSRPFHPFTLVLRDGRRLAVDVPHRLAISPKGNELAYGSEMDGPMFIAPADVSTVELNGRQETVRS